MKILHNPRCTKSRQALQLLNEKNIQVEVVEYLKTPLTKEEFQSILDQLGATPMDIMRKGEAIFKENFKGKELTDDQWIDAMLENPKLIERPIVYDGKKAVVGRPTEKVLEML